MTGLIGATGFVGGALRRQTQFDRQYSSANIEEIKGQRFDLLVCAAPSSEKWRANANPDADRASLDTLRSALDTVAADRFVLVSTIDVYAVPIAVDEDSAIDETVLHPYGRHRRQLERHVAAKFGNSLIVRLPAVFGEGLRKNVIFDLLHGDHRFVNAASVLQFYDIGRVWGDIRRALDLSLPSLNLSVEPLPVGDVATGVFEVAVEAKDGAAQYDMRSKHARHFGRTGPYLVGAEAALESLKAFVARERHVRH